MTESRHNDPPDMLDPTYERGFRRGYINGMYDAIQGARLRLTDNEYERLQEWITGTLQPWTTTDLSTAVRPPLPEDVTLRSRGGVDDGPFSLPHTDKDGGGGAGARLAEPTGG